MLRLAFTLLGPGIALLACTGASPETTEQVQPEDPPPSRTDEPPTNDDAASIDALARACEGEQLHQRFAALAPAALEQLARSDHPSARLLAVWERARSFGPDGSLARAGADAIADAIAAELGVAPPGWWVEQLASAKLRDGDSSGPPYYDGQLDSERIGDRRGAWEPGPGDTFVRAGAPLSIADGVLSIDLSVGRVELGPLPDEPRPMIEHARARAGTTIYWAAFSPGSGGFRFPIHAVAAEPEPSQLWTAEVCGPDRKILGGLGLLIAEIVVVQPDAEPADGTMKPGGEVTGIAVFTAETHGVALDVLDPKTGERTLAWSSDFWFAR